MGFRISWIGFHGLSKSEVLEIIGGVDTGVPDEANEAPFSGAEFPDGWFILFANDFGFVTRELLASWSAKGSVAACQVHETIMVSAAYGYERGAEQWALVHDAQNRIRDLSVSGRPPAAFEEIRDRLSRQQEESGGENADVDYFFDIPLETAEALCGYKHDRGTFDWGEPAFTVLDLGAGPGGEHARPASSQGIVHLLRRGVRRLMGR